MELKIHPEELTFVSAKYLQDQASRVEKNMVVMETEYRIDKKKTILALIIITVMKKIPI